MKSCFLCILTLGLLAGCGPSPEVVQKQEQKQEAALEKQMIDPPGMSAEDRAARRRRIELQYGPDALKKYDEANREQSSK